MKNRQVIKVLIGIFVAAFLFGAVCYCGLPVPRNVELPLGDLNSIVVDAAGNIYCDSAFYNRIQVYSNTGKFLEGWYVQGKHLCQLRLDKQQHLVVTTTKGQFVFDTNGIKLSEDTLYRPNDLDKAKSFIQDKVGNYYTIENKYIFPHIEVHPESGPARSVVNGPVYLWPVSGPIPCWLIAIMLIAIYRSMKTEAKIIESDRPVTP